MKSWHPFGLRRLRLLFTKLDPDRLGTHDSRIKSHACSLEPRGYPLGQVASAGGIVPGLSTATQTLVLHTGCHGYYSSGLESCRQRKIGARRRGPRLALNPILLGYKSCLLKLGQRDCPLCKWPEWMIYWRDGNRTINGNQIKGFFYHPVKTEPI